MPIFIFVFVVFNSGYCLFLLYVLYHWNRIQPVTTTSGSKQEKPIALSVIIPVRNEAGRIELLLQDLGKQHTGNYIFEAWVVDDESTDETRQIVKEFKSKVSYPLHLLQAVRQPGLSPKKQALAQGIARASGEIIITTDGDCRVGKKWLTGFAGSFQNPHNHFVFGPVSFYRESTLFEHMQTVEFASLIGVGGASLQAGHPNMCNGANLAFRKSVFYELGGYHDNLHIPSGDDEFLMKKAFSRYPEGISFLKGPEHTVYTLAKAQLSEFYHQRRRWAGKWKLHKDWRVALLALAVFSYHAMFLVTVGLTLCGLFPWTVLTGGLGIKIFLEGLLLTSVLQDSGKRFRPFPFIVTQLLYAVYAVFFGIAANTGKYTWKGRAYR
mgnify:CR=1 FL=1